MIRSLRLLAYMNVAVMVTASVASVAQADEVIPRGQSKPPGPALSPADAIAKMTVPDGFSVELVAAEPDIMNPVAMTFDEKGRIWVTESFEYPRSEPGRSASCEGAGRHRSRWPRR
ncbi:MAG: hypothetical protein R3C99_22530 [Pirellulaceae bacterium]